MPSAFDAVLSQAIDDLMAHGFDSQERVDRWLRLLREAARNSMVSAESMEQQLRDALAARYRKFVDEGGIQRMSPGVDRFTLDRIKPSLRAELDRRIMASAQLIRLNREQAIEKTLQRFSGWSTSIPKGGVSAETKREVRKNVKKSMQNLPFEERRVLIDQGHKLVSAINEVVAKDGGAIAGEWHSHWRQAGYDYREDHRERDEQFYLVRNSWAHAAGLVKPGKVGYVDESTAPGQEVFCRCFYTWVFNLRDLPEDMLTAKGKRSLKAAQARTDEVGARADAQVRETRLVDVDQQVATALARAAALDRMGWMPGLREVRVVPDRDRWHAQYDDATDSVELQAKFSLLSPDDKVEMLLHEVGHRGQALEPKFFGRFRRANLAKMASFASMANAVHLEDLRRTGAVDGGMASEVFAESYGRAMTGRPVPADLAGFWTAAVAKRRQLRPKAEVVYTDVWRNRPTRCARCSMFMPNRPGWGTCTAVAGDISAHGHCELFRAVGYDEQEPAVGFEADRLRAERIGRIVG